MFNKKLAGTLGAGIFALGIAASAAPAQAATFTVNNANNNGAGSLRSAINAANGTAASDEIDFAIPGAGMHTISLDNRLPVITQAGHDRRLLAAGRRAGDRAARRRTRRS